MTTQMYKIHLPPLQFPPFHTLFALMAALVMQAFKPALEGQRESDSGSSLSDAYELLDSQVIPQQLVAKPHVVSVDQLHSIYMTYAATDLGLLVLDTACARTVASIDHLRAYEREIASRYGQECWQIGECESFTFGNCSSQVSNEAWKVPGFVSSRPVVFSTSSLEGSFPCC